MSIDVQPDATLSARVAEEIRVLLARRRMSGRALARRLDVSPGWVSYRLSGTQPIDLNDLDRIASALEVNATDLLPPKPVEGGTGRYLPGERVLAAIGADPVLAEPRRRPRIPGPRRPVRRKDHNRRDQRRPASPVAI